MQPAPKRLLLCDTPRMIDEWQAQTKLWDNIRHEVGYRQKTSQFIFTGSSTPLETAKMHSSVGQVYEAAANLQKFLKVLHQESMNKL